MIGGTDYVFRLPPYRVDDVVDMVRRWAKYLWPNAWYETDDLDGPVALTPDSPEIWFHTADEFFVYEDERAAEEWTEHGAMESNESKMLYVLVKPRYVDGREDHVEVTVVVGQLTPELREQLLKLQDALRSAAFSLNPEEVPA